MKKKGGYFCDSVEVQTTEDTYAGRIMPNADDHKIVLKLSSGYNIGIYKKNVKKIKVIGNFTGSKEQCEKKLEQHPQERGASDAQSDQHLPTISILHTGGTVASQVDYETGAVTPRFTPQDLLQMFPELKAIANIR